MRIVLAVFAALTLLPSCSELWDAGEITVAVDPTPVQINQSLAVTLHNGTSRTAFYNGCQDVTLEHLDGSVWKVVLPAPGSVCTMERTTFPPDIHATERFVLGGVSAGTYRVAFRPTLDGGRALALSPTFEIR